MEIRLDGSVSDGFFPPPSCYASVKVGEVLKQGRYDAQRWYHFPQADRPRTAKIDIFRHVGAATLSIDPERQFAQEVKVVGSEPAFEGMTMKVDVRQSSSKLASAERDARNEAIAVSKSKAKDYMSLHGIEEKLAKAVRALLKEQPPSPTEFLWRFIRGSGNDGDAATCQATCRNCGNFCNREETAQVDIDQLRANARDMLFKASADGALSQILQEVQQEALSTDIRVSSVKSVDNLREQACRRLMQACEEGTLEKTLQEVQTESKLNTQKPKDLTTLQKQAGNVLVMAAQDGSLESALKYVGAQPQHGGQRDQQNLAALRKEAGELLLSAASTGILEGHVDEMMKESKRAAVDVANLRKQARTVLVDARDDGRLETCLQEVEVDMIRKRTNDVLAQASADGSLFKAMAAVQTEERSKAELQDLDAMRPSGFQAQVPLSPRSLVLSDVVQTPALPLQMSAIHGLTFQPTLMFI